MMKYLLLIYSAESVWTDESRAACMVESMGIGLELAKQNKFITSAPLQYVATAKTVKVVENETVHTTGPFMETIEHLGGFYVLDLPHLDEAIQVACRLPPAKKGTVEIRPLQKGSLDTSLSTQGIDLVHVDQPAYMLMQYGGQTVSALDQHACWSLVKDCKLVLQLPLCPASSATSAQVRPEGRRILDGACDEASEQLNHMVILKANHTSEVQAVAESLARQFSGTWEIRPLFDLRPIANQVS